MSTDNHSSYTSESVSAGHPDKLCDQISDAILDQALASDKDARIACEVLIKTTGEGAERRTCVVVAGEIGAAAEFDYEALSRKVLVGSGYENPDFGVDLNKLEIIDLVSKQSKDIATGVDGHAKKEDQGAGDQGMVYGYACDETDSRMPTPIDLSHRLIWRHAELFKSGEFARLGPDAKAQVTVAYRDDKPVHIDAIVLSTQHTRDVTLDQLDAFRDEVRERIVLEALPAHLLSDKTRYFINPAGLFMLGGPEADCGLTGRKLIVDTYGGFVRHGGGAFSGKDPSKVDRSAAYAARYVAKNIVAARLASRCEVQVSYSIGRAEPNSVSVHTYGAADGVNDELVRQCFDLRPVGIDRMLDLRRPIYLPTAAYGHFGRDEYRGDAGLFPGEKCDKVDELLAASKKT